MSRITTRTGVLLVIALMCVTGRAMAQPGQPVVQLRPDFSALVSYAAPTAPPASGALLVATFNGAPYPGSPFNIGQATTVASPPLPIGVYTVQVVWGAQASPVTSFTVTSVLGAPNLRAAGVDLNTVTLAWDPASGIVEGHDLEATIIPSGQVLLAPVGPANTVTVRGVYPGTYSVRVRAKNALGPGPWSNAITVVVGRVLALGDLQATLTWNSTADIDLHILEPDFSHVYYGNMQGPSARLDFDDVDGYGPETMFVASGRSLPGIYQIYLVHAGQNVETTSTVSITLGVNTDAARTVIFTRRTRRASPNTSVMVALINVQTGEVVEMVSPGGDQIAIDQSLLTGAPVAEKPK